jgi:hypothetical protein
MVLLFGCCRGEGASFGESVVRTKGVKGRRVLWSDRETIVDVRVERGLFFPNMHTYRRGFEGVRVCLVWLLSSKNQKSN